MCCSVHYIYLNVPMDKILLMKVIKTLESTVGEILNWHLSSRDYYQKANFFRTDWFYDNLLKHSTVYCSANNTHSSGTTELGWGRGQVRLAQPNFFKKKSQLIYVVKLIWPQQAFTRMAPISKPTLWSL